MASSGPKRDAKFEANSLSGDLRGIYAELEKKWPPSENDYAGRYWADLGDLNSLITKLDTIQTSEENEFALQTKLASVKQELYDALTYASIKPAAIFSDPDIGVKLRTIATKSNTKNEFQEAKETVAKMRAQLDALNSQIDKLDIPKDLQKSLKTSLGLSNQALSDTEEKLARGDAKATPANISTEVKLIHKSISNALITESTKLTGKKPNLKQQNFLDMVKEQLAAFTAIITRTAGDGLTRRATMVGGIVESKEPASPSADDPFKAALREAETINRARGTTITKVVEPITRPTVEVKAQTAEEKELAKITFEVSQKFIGGPAYFRDTYEEELKLQRANLENLRRNLVEYKGSTNVESEIKKVDAMINDFNKVMEFYKAYKGVMEGKGHDAPDIEAINRQRLIQDFSKIEARYQTALENLSKKKGTVVKSPIFDKFETLLAGTKRTRDEVEFIKAKTNPLSSIDLTKGTFAKKRYSGPGGG